MPEVSQRTAPYEGYARFYDQVQGDGVLRIVKRRFAWLVRHYGIRFGTAADVACGTGGFAAHLASFGVPVFGVDKSTEMLARARERVQGRDVQLLSQDMRFLDLPFRVDLITCNFDSLNYLLRLADLQRAFGRFRANLNVGGHLIFDMVTDAWRSPLLDREDVTLPGVHSRWVVAWDPQTHVRRVSMRNDVFTAAGRSVRTREVHVERAYPITDVQHLLSVAPMWIRGIRDARTLQRAGEGTARAIFVARRT